ncbi:MAG: FG-GAP repeat domain-containing protein [Woeseiaceae bacterium]
MRLAIGLVTLSLIACGGGGKVIDLTEPADLELRENISGLAAADMNADGLNDLIVGSSLVENRQLISSRVSIYRQNPLAPGSFLSPTHVDYASNVAKAYWLVGADLQLDGLIDIVATGWQEGGFRVLLNDSADPGSLKQTVHYPHGPANSSFGQSQSVGDIDGDGLPDVIRVTEDAVSWFPQDGSSPGAFLGAISIGAGTTSVVATDITGDDLTDVVVLGGELGDSVLIYPNNTNSPGQFLAPIDLEVPFFADDLALADYDNNGLMDIALLGSDPNLDTFLSDGMSMIFRQFTTGRFIATDIRTTGGSGITDGFATGNLNDNSMPDIVFWLGGTMAQPNILQIMEFEHSGNPTMLFEMEVPWDNTIRSNVSPIPVIVIADVNNDLLADIAILSRGILVFFQRPGQPGTFDNAIRINTPL